MPSSKRPWRIEIAHPAGDWDYITSLATRDRGLAYLRDYQALWPDHEYRLVNYAANFCETDPSLWDAS
jgi:hypothetical protein